ncbi:GDP-mannose 4,6-dehydratase [Salibaculum halophilum]|uniref:GDP-mannose 4,6-dehydratase n=1 Tax=Salibaculum halophilum TaxID=1914408 RepID=UPI000A10A6FE|nr:GDP-mannose 4,6-dehydratase [Salibaculum halophilum]
MTAKVFITGTSGFVGFHLARLLLEEGATVHGYDAMTEYYDIRLKQARQDILETYERFSSCCARLEDASALDAAIKTCAPDVIVHLAAQAGVRYSIEAPRSYLDSNILGTFNLLETVRHRPVGHLLLASTSSAYGANQDMPYTETDKADTQMSFYAATKKATEAIGHSYAHLYGIPTTMFRFFTVYGPWGRPDMALFKFTRAILNDESIEVYNHGRMRRDFTYVGDLVRAVRLLIDTPPDRLTGKVTAEDSLSPVAPFRIVNIGNSEPVDLMDFIRAIETATDSKARKTYLDMQPGDVPATWADSTLLHALTGYRPQTPVTEGVAEFVAWYRQYHGL